MFFFASSRCSQVARLESGNNSRPFVSIFMETTAQHFPNFEGDLFTEPRPSDDVARSLKEHGKGVHGVEHSVCIPQQCEDLGAQGEPRWKNWRNRVLAEEAPRFSRHVYVAPMGDVTATLSDAHVITQTFKFGRSNGWGSECSHFCYSPGLAEAAAYLVHKAVVAIDQKILPSELDWRPPGILAF
jgi:hypothetical protein